MSIPLVRTPPSGSINDGGEYPSDEYSVGPVVAPKITVVRSSSKYPPCKYFSLHVLPAVAPQYDGWGVLFRGASSRDDASGDEPELRLEHALEEVLNNASDARPTRIEATLIDRKTSRG